MRRRQETVTEKFYRLRGVIFVVSVPLLLILTVLALMPRSSPYDYSGQSDDPLDHKSGMASTSAIIPTGGEGDKYAVIIDCGSSGSRIHVYHFNSEMDLLEINGELELFIAIKPGVSAYKDSPKEAGESLRQLLDKAKEVIPAASQKTTPIKVGATAGLRMVGQEIADSILEEIRKVLEEYPFTFAKESVSILEGSMEGSFAWMSINYLLGKLGEPYGETVGVVDLGGGSVQMTYAISDKARAAAPSDKDIVELTGKGHRYNIFVHSFLNYGLLAFRAELLKLGKSQDGNPCVAEGFKGEYEYPSRSGTTYRAEAREEGAAFKACKSMVVKALELEKPCGIEGGCSFAGVWNGGAGSGLKSLYVLSFFFDRAVQVGIIKDPEASTATVTVSDFSQAAESACKLSVSNVAATYPLVDDGKAEDPKDAQYLCLDLTYCAALLKDGFGFKSSEQITLVKKISYQQKDVEAQWSLGAAINALG